MSEDEAAAALAVLVVGSRWRTEIKRAARSRWNGRVCTILEADLYWGGCDVRLAYQFDGAKFPNVSSATYFLRSHVPLGEVVSVPPKPTRAPVSVRLSVASELSLRLRCLVSAIRTGDDENARADALRKADVALTAWDLAHGKSRT